MSIQAVAWVLEHSEATLADRLVLIAIANHADARGWNAWPAIPQIAREARCGRATVFRALEALEQIGELAIDRRPGRSNMYGIPALMGSHIETGRGSQNGTGEGSQNGTGRGSQIETGGVSSTQQRGPRLRPKPSLTVNEPSRARATTTQQAMPPALPDDVKARGAEFFRSLRRGET